MKKNEKPPYRITSTYLDTGERIIPLRAPVQDMTSTYFHKFIAKLGLAAGLYYRREIKEFTCVSLN